MTRLHRLLYVCVGGAWVAAALGWIGSSLVWLDAALDSNENAVAAARSSLHSAVGGVLAAATLTANVGWFMWKSRNKRNNQ